MLIIMLLAGSLYLFIVGPKKNKSELGLFHIFFITVKVILWTLRLLQLLEQKRHSYSFTVAGLVISFCLSLAWISLERPPLRTMVKRVLVFILPPRCWTHYLRRWRYKWLLFSNIINCLYSS